MEMTKVYVLINNINSVKDLCNAANSVSFDIDVVSGRYIIDAKSIIGLFSLDLSKPLEVNIHETDEVLIKPFMDRISSFVLKDNRK